MLQTRYQREQTSKPGAEVRSSGRGVRLAEASMSSALAAAGRPEVVAAAQADGLNLAGERVAFARVVEKGSEVVVKFVELHPFDFLADESLDGGHVRALLGHHDGEGIAGGLGAAGPADALAVIVRMLRQ